jgi:hypothetical protein
VHSQLSNVQQQFLELVLIHLWNGRIIVDLKLVREGDFRSVVYDSFDKETDDVEPP